MIRKSNVYHMLQIGLVLSQFLPGTLATVEAAQLVYENTLESGWGDVRYVGYSDKELPPACKFNTKFRLESDPAGGGGQVAMVTQPGDSSCLIPAPDLKHRAEIGLTNSAGDGWWLKPGVETWIGYRIYVPSSHPNNCEDAINFTARRFGKSEHSTGFTTLRCNGSTPFMRVAQVYTNAASNHVVGDEKDVSLKRDAWNDIIIRVKWVNSTAGYYELYHNGTRVINWQGVITAGDFEGDFKLDMGLYWGTQNRTGTYRVFYDNIRIATGADGFELVNPGNGAAPLATLSAPTNLSLKIQPIIK